LSEDGSGIQDAVGAAVDNGLETQAMEAFGPVLLVLSIPMMLRWVLQNRLFGFRVPATLHHKSVWYDANALSGCHFFLLGLLLVALEFVLPLTMRISVLRVIASVGVVVIMAADWWRACLV
jgi:hypothetical protein